MTNLSTLTTEICNSLTVKDGQVYATSLDVAARFNKRHDHVIRAIKTLDCPEEFNHPNFGLVTYTDNKGETRPCYNLTRKGCTYLILGFTGKEAGKFKAAYIDAFDEMERRLRQQQPTATNVQEKPSFEHLTRTPGQIWRLMVQNKNADNIVKLSARAIGIELGISRATAQRHISQLREMGWLKYSDTDKGYIILQADRQPATKEHSFHYSDDPAQTALYVWQYMTDHMNASRSFICPKNEIERRLQVPVGRFFQSVDALSQHGCISDLTGGFADGNKMYAIHQTPPVIWPSIDNPNQI